MNRRDFVSAVAGLAVVPFALASRAEFPTHDFFTWRDWTVRWTGWRRATTHFVEIGAWYATREAREGFTRIWVATTHGRCHEMRSIWQMFDVTREDGWPLVGPMTSQAERDAVKTRALNALLKTLDRS